MKTLHLLETAFVLTGLLLIFSCGQEEITDPGPEPVPLQAELSSATVWHQANLTNFESYPDPNSDECILYNGCQWAGQFAFVSGVKPESWVEANNIIAVHSRDAYQYKLKTLRIKQGNRQIDAVVYDYCSDTDCDGCCTTNADENGIGFLIDMEKYTMQRFGSGSGIVEWTCLDCD